MLFQLLFHLVFLDIEDQQASSNPQLNDHTLQSQYDTQMQQLPPEHHPQQHQQQQQLLQPTATPQFEVKQEARQVIKRTTGVQVRPSTVIDPLQVDAKPFQCKVCNKSYRKNANLRIHMRTHTGEKPFECKYCDKKFYHSSHLREHIRRHTGEKPFQCAVCNKRFTIKGEIFAPLFMELETF